MVFFNSCDVKKIFLPMLRRFFEFSNARDSHFFSLTSLIFNSSPLLFSPSLSVASSLFLSLRFLLWSFLSLFCIVALLLLLLLVLVLRCCRWLLRCSCCCCHFRLCSLSFRPLLSSCQVHSSARRDTSRACELIITMMIFLFFFFHALMVSMK